MPSPKFIVSSRATKGGPTQQVTIPAAIARNLPQEVSIRWELSVVKGGLFFKYLGPNVETPDAPEVTLDFVPASDLKTKPAPKKKAEPVEVKAHPQTVIDGTTVVVDDSDIPEDHTGDESSRAEDAATDSTAEQAEEAEVSEEDLEEAPF